jgi:hypothetical protein
VQALFGPFGLNHNAGGLFGVTRSREARRNDDIRKVDNLLSSNLRSRDGFLFKNEVVVDRRKVWMRGLGYGWEWKGRREGKDEVRSGFAEQGDFEGKTGTGGTPKPGQPDRMRREAVTMPRGGTRRDRRRKQSTITGGFGGKVTLSASFYSYHQPRNQQPTEEANGRGIQKRQRAKEKLAAPGQCQQRPGYLAGTGALRIPRDELRTTNGGGAVML